MASSSSQYCRRSLPDTSARLPALTKVDSPSPRPLTFSRIAEPSAPDWQKNPARPRGGITGASEAFSETSCGGVDHPEAVGTDQPQAVRAGQPDQLALPLAALLAGLGEAAGDHDQPVHALGRALEHDVLHRVCGHRHDRHVDVTGDVAHRAVRRHPGHRVGGRVHHVDPARVVAEHQVAHQQRADGRAAPRGTDDGDAARVQEGRDRGRLGAVLARRRSRRSRSRWGRCRTRGASRPRPSRP